MSFNYLNNSPLEIEYISDQEIIINGSGVINDKGCVFFSDTTLNKKCFDEDIETIDSQMEKEKAAGEYEDEGDEDNM